MLKCLTSDGEMVVTFPLGYNSEMDNLLKDNELCFTETYFLKRISHDNSELKLKGIMCRMQSMGIHFVVEMQLLLVLSRIMERGEWTHPLR